MLENKNGFFVISLDFELMWGVRDVLSFDQYGDNLLGVQKVIPTLLNLFQQYNISATFATVGLLFFENKEEMLAGLPNEIPDYLQQHLSPYNGYIENNVGKNYKEDPIHFAPHLIKLIQQTPGQEIATHTFCHYYCLEPGQTAAQFAADLQSAIDIAQKRGVEIQSIVFPRNQFNDEYIDVCNKKGVVAYRNNEESWIYEARNANDENLFRRAFRLIDAYLNITGYHCYPITLNSQKEPVNIPSSRFLRPYSPQLKMFEKLRLRRIKSAMTHAAKNNLMYHLWWHPHNFGINQEKNFAFLEEILIHFNKLQKQYNFQSTNMKGLANLISNAK